MKPRLAFARLACLLAMCSPLAAQDVVIPLWPEGVPDRRADTQPGKSENERTSNVHEPTLTLFTAPPSTACGTAVIVCPGGGYVRLSWEKEGVAVARWLNSIGVTAFVLKYRMVEYGQPAPLRDALRAIRTVRSRAAEFGVQPDRIGILGSSAGGHLASCAATLFDRPEGRTGAAIDTVSARPDFAVLMYPVITMHPPFAHAGSRRSLLGENPAPELIELYSTDLQVTNQTPPTFLFHTSEDASVPAENSLRFYQALRRANIPAEMHIYEKGGHGVGLLPGNGPTATWPKRCEDWLRLHGWLTAPAASQPGSVTK
jgi:acetyl esterase/lipase